MEKTLSLTHYTNATFEEEEALVDEDNGDIIASGDYYHNHISEYIAGAIRGLEYIGFEVDVVEKRIGVKDEMFQHLGFYEGDEEDD